MPHKANNQPSRTCMKYSKKVNGVKNSQKQLKTVNICQSPYPPIHQSPSRQIPQSPYIQFLNLSIYGDKKYMGRDKIADKQTDREINTMNRPGLRAGSIENMH